MRIDLARAVIDASGTWRNPSPLGAAGAPAVGESALPSGSLTGFPMAWAKSVKSGRVSACSWWGGGHSAANVLLNLARLAEGGAELRITWAVRSRDLARVLGSKADDKLPARGKLAATLGNSSKANSCLSSAASPPSALMSAQLYRSADARTVRPHYRRDGPTT